MASCKSPCNRCKDPNSSPDDTESQELASSWCGKPFAERSSQQFVSTSADKSSCTGQAANHSRSARQQLEVQRQSLRQPAVSDHSRRLFDHATSPTKDPLQQIEASKPLGSQHTARRPAFYKNESSWGYSSNLHQLASGHIALSESFQAKSADRCHRASQKTFVDFLRLQLKLGQFWARERQNIRFSV